MEMHYIKSIKTRKLVEGGLKSYSWIDKDQKIKHMELTSRAQECMISAVGITNHLM
jgi:hypothetical protein